MIRLELLTFSLLLICHTVLSQQTPENFHSSRGILKSLYDFKPGETEKQRKSFEFYDSRTMVHDIVWEYYLNNEKLYLSF